MHLFLEKDDELRLTIIKYFSRITNRWYTRNELSEALNISPKKISTLIKTINDDLINVYGDEVYLIESCSGRGFSLEKNPTTWKKLEIYYFERSLSFSFIKKTIFDSQLTTIEFCLNNFTSLATLNRKLRQIIPILRSFDLKLNVSKGYLIGQEIRIRQFYYELFKNIYGNYKWPIEGVEKETLQEQIEKFSKVTESELNFIDRYIMEIYFAVIVTRIRQHHYVDSDLEEYRWLDNHPIYSIIHHFVTSQFKQLDSKTVNLESDYFIFLFMTSMVIDRSNNMVKKEIEFLKDNNVREYMLVQNLQKKIIDHYKSEKLVLTTQLTYVLTRSVISFEKFEHVIDMKEKEIYLQKEQNKYPKFFHFIEEEVVKQMSGEMTHHQIELLLTEIIPILKANIPIIKYENPIKIGFFYETDLARQYVAQNRITEKVNQKVLFETNEQELVNMDIVLVDEKSYLGIKDKISQDVPIIPFDNTLSDSSIKKLESAIEKIEK